MPEPSLLGRSHPIVTDGGLGTLLESMGADVRGPAWSAAALHDDPDAIRAAHLAFFEAGADLAVSASYQISFDGPAAAGATPDETQLAIIASTRLAREAATIAEDRDGRARLVAASVGPYGASLADGSEYTGDYGLTIAELRAWHRPRLQALAATAPDLLAIETVPSAAEAEALLVEVAELGLPAWLSMTADGALTRTGERLDEVFTMAAEVPTVIAVGANCCSRAGIEAAIAAASVAVPGLQRVVSPNGPGIWDAAARAWLPEAAPPDPLASATAWLAAGVTIIGGCCRVTPAHIRSLRARVDATIP